MQHQGKMHHRTLEMLSTAADLHTIWACRQLTEDQTQRSGLGERQRSVGIETTQQKIQQPRIKEIT